MERGQALTCDNNTDRANFFLGGYSAVTKINTRFLEKLKTDKKLRMGVQEIIEHLSHVKAGPRSMHIPGLENPGYPGRVGVLKIKYETIKGLKENRRA